MGMKARTPKYGPVIDSKNMASCWLTGQRWWQWRVRSGLWTSPRQWTWTALTWSIPGEQWREVLR